MEKQTFGSTEIQGITGLSKMSVIHLTQTGVIRPLKDARGRGQRRVYSWQNLIELLVCRELYRFKIESQQIKGYLRALNRKSLNCFTAKNLDDMVKLNFWEMVANDPFIVDGKEHRQDQYFLVIEGEKASIQTPFWIFDRLNIGELKTELICNLKPLIEEVRRKIT